MTPIQLAALQDAQRGDFELADSIELIERAKRWLAENDDGVVAGGLIEIRVPVPDRIPRGEHGDPERLPKLHGNGGRMRYIVVEYSENRCGDHEWGDEDVFDLDGREVDYDTVILPAASMTVEHARQVVAAWLAQHTHSATLFPSEAPACA